MAHELERLAEMAVAIWRRNVPLPPARSMTSYSEGSAREDWWLEWDEDGDIRVLSKCAEGWITAWEVQSATSGPGWRSF